MIIAVVAVGMVQVTIDQIVEMVAMGDDFMPASGTMDMFRIMTITRMRRCALRRVLGVDLQSMFFDLAVVADMMQVSVVQVIDMVAMPDAGVVAIRTVLVVVLRMQICHDNSLRRKKEARQT